MGLLTSLYKLSEVPSDQFNNNYRLYDVYSEDVIYAHRTFTIQRTNYELDGLEEKDIHSVYWNFGDPFSKNNEEIRYDLNDTTHLYTRNGIYNVDCVINAGPYTIHINTKVSVLLRTVKYKSDFVSAAEYFEVNINCYDPQALIMYQYDTHPGVSNWLQYFIPFKVEPDCSYYRYKIKLSTGEDMGINTKSFRPVKLKIFDVYTPTATADIDGDIVVTEYTTAGLPTYTGTWDQVNDFVYDNMSKAVKIAFYLGDNDDLLDPSLSDSGITVLYRLESQGGSDSDMYEYTDHIIIPRNDVLYYQFLDTSGEITYLTAMLIYNFNIKEGVEHDIATLNSYVYNY